HGQPGLPIDLCIDPEADRTTFAVANVGAPIPPETRTTMFRAFEGHGSSNRRNRTGLGLGLFIASQVVEGHGGKLEYVHKDGKVVFRGSVPTAD
ncbi:MAG: ATP-binding protein, partial [Verrucomicrobiaceae bacterium]